MAGGDELEAGGDGVEEGGIGGGEGGVSLDHAPEHLTGCDDLLIADQDVIPAIMQITKSEVSVTSFILTQADGAKLGAERQGKGAEVIAVYAEDLQQSQGRAKNVLVGGVGRDGQEVDTAFSYSLKVGVEFGVGADGAGGDEAVAYVDWAGGDLTFPELPVGGHADGERAFGKFDAFGQGSNPVAAVGGEEADGQDGEEKDAAEKQQQELLASFFDHCVPGGKVHGKHQVTGERRGKSRKLLDRLGGDNEKRGI